MADRFRAVAIPATLTVALAMACLGQGLLLHAADPRAFALFDSTLPGSLQARDLQGAGRTVLMTRAELERLQRRLSSDIRAVTRATLDRAARNPGARVLDSIARDGYRLDSIELGDGTLARRALVAVPDAPGRRPATLRLEAIPMADAAAAGGDLDLLASDGDVVMVLSPPDPARTLGVRIDDVVRAVAWLRAQRFVSDVRLHGVDVSSLVALHAAVLLGDRVSAIVLEDLLVSYRLAPPEVLNFRWPGVVTASLPDRYDVGDLITATFPQRLSLVTPRNAWGEPMAATTFATLLEHVFRSERDLQSIGNESAARIAVLFLP